MILIPNLITLARLIAVPLVIWLVLENELAVAFWIFVAAGVSDGVDGFIAKRFNARTRIGAYLDPLADKALLMSIYVTLGVEGYIPKWLVIMVVSRDIFILGGVTLLQWFVGTVQMAPLLVSKLNTVVQLLLAGLVLGQFALGFDGMPLMDAVIQGLILAVAFTTLTSGTAYLMKWGRFLSGAGS